MNLSLDIYKYSNNIRITYAKQHNMLYLFRMLSARVSIKIEKKRHITVIIWFCLWFMTKRQKLTFQNAQEISIILFCLRARKHVQCIQMGRIMYFVYNVLLHISFFVSLKIKGTHFDNFSFRHLSFHFSIRCYRVKSFTNPIVVNTYMHLLIPHAGKILR